MPFLGKKFMYPKLFIDDIPTIYINQFQKVLNFDNSAIDRKKTKYSATWR